jgi:hypothetical protein
MGDNFFSVGRIAWLVGVTLLVMIANVVISILYMVIYSYAIDPGHDPQYYNDHIQVAAPYCSIVAGIPLMFLAAWWAGRRWQGKFSAKSAIAIWLIYAVIDLSIILMAGAMTSRLAILVAVSILTKLAAVYLGAMFASSSRTP